MATKKPERIIAVIGGDSGSGKSFFVANLADALIYDTALAGGLAYADDLIASQGSERVEVASYVDVLRDLQGRARDGRVPRSVVIDHVTALQQEGVLRHNPQMVADYGRANSQATAEWRHIRNFCKSLDCNLIVTAHMKGEWVQDKQGGMTIDGGKNIEGDVGIVLYLEHEKGGAYPARAQVIKWRRLPDDPRGTIPRTFPLLMEKFVKLCGQDLTRVRDPVTLASEEQVAELTALLDHLNLPEPITDTKAKWLLKSRDNGLPPELDEERAKAAIEYCQKLLRPAT